MQLELAGLRRAEPEPALTWERAAALPPLAATRDEPAVADWPGIPARKQQSEQPEWPELLGHLAAGHQPESPQPLLSGAGQRQPLRVAKRTQAKAVALPLTV
jgi:hypothetical protein